jgi:hypothetical protein
MPIVTASTSASPSVSISTTADASRSNAAKAAAVSALAQASSTAATPVDPPSSTVTLSPQALSLSNASHPGSAAVPGAPGPSLAPLPGPSSSVYESLKNGISTAVSDVGEAVAGGAHLLAEGVETVSSAADTAIHGVVDLPFAVIGKACDAAGAVLDAI